jgi:hypothetical protein
VLADEYRAYEAECMQWARSAKSDREREIFLQMAQTWFEAARIAVGDADPSSFRILAMIPFEGKDGLTG